MWSYNDSVAADTYDPEAAKSCSKKPALPASPIDLWAMPVSRPYNPNAQRVAELIQADWAKIGVTANIVTYGMDRVPRSRRKQPERKGPFQIGWTGDNGDPDNFFATLFACSAIGVSNYSHVVQPGVRGHDPGRQDDLRSGRAHQALRRGAGHLQGRSAGHDDRPLARCSCR